MEELTIEARGGHIVLPDGRGVPGNYANCNVVIDPDTLQVLRIEPLPQAASPPPKSSPAQEIVQAGDQAEASLAPSLPAESEVPR